MMEFKWAAFEAWTLEQPNVNMVAMASVSGSIQDMADALGRQEHDAAYKLVHNYWTKENMSTEFVWI